MGLRLSCASLAFSDVGWEEALGEIGELGFGYADLAMFEGWTHVWPSRLREPERHGERIRKVAAEVGVEPIAIHANFKPGGRQDFPGLSTPEEEAREEVLEHFGRVVRCAAAAGVRLVNVQPGKRIAGESREACLERSSALLGRMQETAAAEKVTLSFENHTGSLGERPEDALALLEAVPGLKLDFDFSHVAANSITLEECRPLLKHVAHVGVRNAKPGSYNEPVRGGKLDYPLEVYLEALEGAGVEAFVSVEYYQPKMREHIAPLKGILEEAGVRG